MSAIHVDVSATRGSACDRCLAAGHPVGVAGRLRILWRIILPLSKPALATLGVFTFIREWNAFLWPLIATTSPDMRTLSVGLTLFTGQYGTEWHLLMAAATVTLLPTLLIFVLAQRYFVQGIALTGFGGR